ncbi:MAG: CspA family cold shock protein [Marinosulfonomonas sp.]|nr:CspA family cold shock protein [Marinosulfonomonas sp.]
MNEEEKKEHQLVRGQVKWFDQGKGFGFVLSDDGGPDILLHANVLRNFGQSSVADQAGIEILVQETGRGLQTTEILRIDPPVSPENMEYDDFGDFDDDADMGDLEPARVKWFDKAKGFGFANAFGSADDVFVHVEVLRRSGLADLQPGEAVCIRVIDGERGHMAAQVVPWDVSFRDDE